MTCGRPGAKDEVGVAVEETLAAAEEVAHATLVHQVAMEGSHSFESAVVGVVVLDEVVVVLAFAGEALVPDEALVGFQPVGDDGGHQVVSAGEVAELAAVAAWVSELVAA